MTASVSHAVRSPTQLSRRSSRIGSPTLPLEAAARRVPSPAVGTELRGVGRVSFAGSHRRGEHLAAFLVTTQNPLFAALSLIDLGA